LIIKQLCFTSYLLVKVKKKVLKSTNNAKDEWQNYLSQQELDTYLTEVHDQPTIAGYGRAAKTNTLLHQLPFFC
jgi:hypothetical protein